MLEVNKDNAEICISCCDKSKSANKISINRGGSIYKGSNITTFALCDECLKQLAKEFVQFS